jgi:hypothetical protein
MAGGRTRALVQLQAAAKGYDFGQSQPNPKIVTLRLRFCLRAVLLH